MPLPPDVQVDSGPDTTRVVLPVRPRTAPKWVGCGPIIFGMIFAGVAIGQLTEVAGCSRRQEAAPIVLPAPEEDPIAPEAPVAPEAPAPGPEVARPATALENPPVDAPGPLNIVEIIFGAFLVLFMLPFLAVGVVAIGAGVLMFFPNHAEIEITADKLTALERTGPARFRRRRLISQISRLRIGTVLEKSSKGHTTGQYLALFAEGAEGETPLRLAPRYPKETLSAVGEFLVQELKRRGQAASLLAAPGAAATLVSGGKTASDISMTIDPDTQPATESSIEPAPEEPAWPQPAQSKITFLEQPDTLTFLIPRTGFRGGARVLLIFALFWNGISVPIFLVTVSELFTEPTLENLGAAAFVSIFPAIGIAFLLGAIQVAFRKAVILATRQSLVFTQTGPIRKSEYQWPAEKLTAIRYGNSNTTVNGKVLQELQVESSDPANALCRGLLVGWEEEELRWLSQALRRFYRVRA